MGDDHATLRAEHGYTARHGTIVGKAAIAVQFDPVRKTALNVIQRERPLSMPRDLHPLPCRQIVVNMTATFREALSPVLSPPNRDRHRVLWNDSLNPAAAAPIQRSAFQNQAVAIP